MPSFYTRNQADNFVLARIRRQGVRYETTFLVSEYGTWEKAEAAAKQWVKATLPSVPKPMHAKNRKTRRNTSGVVGVRLANATKKKNGNIYTDHRWVAFWPDCPNSGGVGWSVKKYGEERAFVSAVLARQSESIDRVEIDAKYQKVRSTAEFSHILANKLISAP